MSSLQFQEAYNRIPRKSSWRPSNLAAAGLMRSFENQNKPQVRNGRDEFVNCGNRRRLGLSTETIRHPARPPSGRRSSQILFRRPFGLALNFDGHLSDRTRPLQVHTFLLPRSGYFRSRRRTNCRPPIQLILSRLTFLSKICPECRFAHEPGGFEHRSTPPPSCIFPPFHRSRILLLEYPQADRHPGNGKAKVRQPLMGQHGSPLPVPDVLAFPPENVSHSSVRGRIFEIYNLHPRHRRPKVCKSHT